MKFIVAICLFALLNSITYSVFSQKQVEIAGEKYVLHKVLKSETIYSICQQYKVTQKELLEANPGLTAILKSGSTVKVPVGKVVPEQKKQESKVPQKTVEEFYYHKVVKKQTIFSIAKQYGYTANDLIRFNPELSNGLVAGQVLKIPVKTSDSDNQSESQYKTTYPVMDGSSGYIYHPVVSGETLYSLEQRFNISHQEMMSLNPSLQDGLKTGMKLKIPVSSSQKPTELVFDSKSFNKYQIEKGETLFSISSRFGIEVGELKKANPSLFSRSLETGETILIPKNSAFQKVGSIEGQKNTAEFMEEIGTGYCDTIQGINNQKYKAGLLLPFHLPAYDKNYPDGISKSLLLSRISLNDPVDTASLDTTVVTNGVNIDQKALGFIEFYEGALLAIDSLQRNGMNIELFVFDASNQQNVNTMLQMDEFRDLNLIIGPVYPEFQETVASFAAKNRIPMISPLSSGGNFEQNNSWYFKVNPTKEYQSEQTATYIAREFANKNFFLLQFSDNSDAAAAKLAELTKAKLTSTSFRSKFHEYNFQRQGVNQIKPLLDENGVNIFMIPSDNEAQVSVAVTNLTALAEHYDIVLIGTPALTKFKSIQIENYHRIRLRYLSPYFTDYERPLVRRFVSLYRENYIAEPSQFSYQGFDVAYYFLSAIQRFGKDFRNCLPNYPMELTQMNFRFRKVAPMGGFENESMFVTSFERNFDVLSLGAFPNPRINQKK